MSNQPRPRTWRPMAMWAAGILALAVLICYIVAIAASAWRLRDDIAMCHDTMGGYPHIWPEKRAKGAVTKLGSPERAIMSAGSQPWA